ncbi:WXG100 family type VII secretion target [Dactylosporangium sp. AC04546]|uniref:WXG100 family type VII secretion target n=1 Tax=Dactylosporangium sp. AC04546 TaxID=2862460 RepID=UPI001EE0727A|nr:WXG100 family type VII secretion target [Dactylosporangium sp. AC04546]WVK84076.1 WXG100 family type VII secretion target [Dactylosporangium sp. AC04546]
MDDMLVVNFGAMEHAGQSIQTALNTLNARLDEVSQLGRRLTSGWQGEAREAYAARQAGWERAGNDLALMLKDIKLALDESMQRYLETEHRNRQLFPGAR